MPKIYKIKVYYTEFEKGQPLALAPLDDAFTFKDLQQFLIDKGMKVRLTLGHFRTDLLERLEDFREGASLSGIPDEELEIPKFFYFPKDVKPYEAKYGYAVEVLTPATSSTNDE